MIVRIKILLCYIKYIIIIMFYSKSNSREVIKEDVRYWCERRHITYTTEISSLVKLLYYCPQFRNLFYFRCLVPNFAKVFCKPDATICIADDMNDIAGGGLYFEHATATRIGCKKMGVGCTFRQLTTIGVKSEKRHEEKPIIGDYVDFGVNVICIGNITIGSHAVIGAGSVVVKDVPDYAIVVGNPARIVGYTNQQNK